MPDSKSAFHCRIHALPVVHNARVIPERLVSDVIDNGIHLFGQRFDLPVAQPKSFIKAVSHRLNIVIGSSSKLSGAWVRFKQAHCDRVKLLHLATLYHYLKDRWARWRQFMLIPFQFDKHDWFHFRDTLNPWQCWFGPPFNKSSPPATIIVTAFLGNWLL